MLIRQALVPRMGGKGIAETMFAETMKPLIRAPRTAAITNNARRAILLCAPTNNPVNPLPSRAAH